MTLAWLWPSRWGTDQHRLGGRSAWAPSWGWRRRTGEAIFYGAPPNDVGCGALPAPLFADTELLARLDDS